MSFYNGMGISELARRTGVGTSTLRAWETRHGFPQPLRLAGGHRRYSDRDVTAVSQVLRERDQGATLRSAIERAKARSSTMRSVMATVRHALPDVEPRRISRRSMLALSRAIEDEMAGETRDAMIVGAFQRAGAYRAVEQRWKHMAVGTRLAVVLAGFPRFTERGAIWEVPIVGDTSLRREWMVICDSLRFSACLVGTEVGGPRSRSGFEAVWTVEPPVVREALRAALRAASAGCPQLGAIDPPRVLSQNAETVVRNMTRLSNRAVAYIAG